MNRKIIKFTLVFSIVSIIMSCLVGCGGSKESQVDEAFMEGITTSMGEGCTFNMSDHSAYFEKSLQEYIGKGSFTQNDISYTYNYRAIIEDNTIVFVKISVFDPNGTEIIDVYDEEKEIEYLDSIED